LATNKTPPWMFGNTTVRSPFRLRDGLLAISQSPIQGNLRGTERDKEFRELLGEHGIVSLGTDETNSVGRKWRAALEKHGFIYPNLPANTQIEGYSVERVDTITPSGWRLISAESVPAIQECFLRALLSFWVPNTLEKRRSLVKPFSPLRFCLSIMLELERNCGSNVVHFNEMALVIQFSNPSTPTIELVKRILSLRKGREQASNKRSYDADTYADAASMYSYEVQTLNDYADLNIRYLKATGLLVSRGRGIAISEGKHLFVEKICNESVALVDNTRWLKDLVEGSSLPTDNIEVASDVVDDLVKQLKNKGVELKDREKSRVSASEVNLLRYDLEEKLFEINEREYAKRQALQWREISSWLQLLSTNPYRAISLDDGEKIVVPQGEAPAYFEWIIWRSFLAINKLVLGPGECRRFKIDQDFLPVGTAPGNGPDLIFEFDDFVLVVEVTLTSSSRQEAVEGEPVRRHVATVVDNYHASNKQVYGLFLTNNVDSNTAETFRLGTWYRADDSRMTLSIVPLKLSEFKSFFDTLFEKEVVECERVRELIERCIGGREEEAPAWKSYISNTIYGYVSELKLLTKVDNV